MDSFVINGSALVNVVFVLLYYTIFTDINKYSNYSYSYCFAYLFCLLVLPIGFAYCFCLLVLPIGFAYWFCLLVLPIGFAYWFCLLVLPIGFAYWFCLLVLRYIRRGCSILASGNYLMTLNLHFLYIRQNEVI